MDVVFEGNWSDREIAQKVQELRKSLGTSDGGGAEETVQLTVAGMLSPRQKRLISLWDKVKDCDLEAGDRCSENSQTWEEYAAPLTKAAIGQIKNKNGKQYRFNRNHRWEAVDDATASPAAAKGTASGGRFSFMPTDGEYGRGVYFPVERSPSAGAIIIRVSVNVAPAQLISGDEFLKLEDDFGQHLDARLAAANVKAIAETDAQRVTLLVVRDHRDIEVLGVISGEVPQGEIQYKLVALEEEGDRFVADIQALPKESVPLEKSARVARGLTWASESKLNGTPLIKQSPSLDRRLIRAAVERCKDDGLDFTLIPVKLTQGRPDFFPEPLNYFCLPSDGVINLCPHDPREAIAHQVRDLTARLQNAVTAGAIAGDIALSILSTAAALDEQWWLEGIIKRCYGAIDCHRIATSGEKVWEPYLKLLNARGLSFWGTSKAITECMAEDFRCAYDPQGLPNLVTLEWDLATPAIARMCQQVLLKTIATYGAPPSELDVLQKTSGKVDKDTVNYNYEDDGRPCESCKNWQGYSGRLDEDEHEMGLCKAVFGEVWGLAHCDLWEKKPRSEREEPLGKGLFGFGKPAALPVDPDAPKAGVYSKVLFSPHPNYHDPSAQTEKQAREPHIKQRQKILKGWELAGTNSNPRDGRNTAFVALDATNPKYGLIEARNADTDHAPSGYLRYNRSGDKFLAIDHIGSDPSTKGSGRSMVEALKAHAKAQGLGIAVNGASTSANDFYKKVGFKPGKYGHSFEIPFENL